MQHETVALLDQSFAAAMGDDLGLPNNGSRYLDSLMSAPTKYSHLPNIAGAWARHVAALNLAARTDIGPLAKIGEAHQLLCAIGRLWAPSSEGIDRGSSTAMKTASVPHSVALLHTPDSPWTVLQYLLAVASSCDDLGQNVLEMLALDLGSARWASGVMLMSDRTTWPGRWHLNEASDVTRNLLFHGWHGVRFAAALAERGHPWPSEVPTGVQPRFAGVKLAYTRTLKQFGMEAAALYHTTLATETKWSEMQLRRWASEAKAS